MTFWFRPLKIADDVEERRTDGRRQLRRRRRFIFAAIFCGQNVQIQKVQKTERQRDETATTTQQKKLTFALSDTIEYYIRGGFRPGPRGHRPPSFAPGLPPSFVAIYDFLQR